MREVHRDHEDELLRARIGAAHEPSAYCMFVGTTLPEKIDYAAVFDHQARQEEPDSI